MSNQGFFELGLLDVAGRPANDTSVKVNFIRVADNKVVAQSTNLVFPPAHRFVLPAFPQERNLFAEVAAPRFRQRRSGIFTLTDGETITRNLTLFRQPGKWAASFDAWDQLPNQHQPLKKVLDKSSAVKVKGGETLGKFTQAAYDNVSNPTTINAKAALLNLYAKLTEMIEPAGEAEPWFSFVREIVEIGRERFIAVVDQRMEQLVRTISNDIGQFPEYKKTPAQNHFGNFPAAFNIVKSKMVSIKSREDHGNVQLTLAQGKDATGNDTFLLDADIDENGKLMAHLADLFKHKFNGGTHPFDIHEFLVLSSPNRPLGYTLV
jgi:hypothetical protein